jgi:hypothetical protein
LFALAIYIAAGAKSRGDRVKNKQIIYAQNMAMGNHYAILIKLRYQIKK